MKQYIFPAIIMAGLIIGAGCHSHDQSNEGHSHGDHDEAHGSEEPEALSFTLRTNKSELFVEFPPLVVERESRFAAHFTDMASFKAITEGNAQVTLLDNDRALNTDEADSPDSPGIFRLGISPAKAGNYDLAFFLDTPEFRDTIILENITVYPDLHEAIHANPPTPEGDQISFLKEQAWKVDFSISEVKRADIHDVIRSSGEILPVKGEEKVVSAKSSGIVFFKSNNLNEGREVKVGESLFSISSQGLVNTNLEEKFKVAQAHLEKARADFDRAEELHEQQIIGQKEFEKRKMELAVAKAEFQTLARGYSAGGQSVTAPISGFIKNINVSDGQFVQEGTPLLRLTNNRRLLLRAELSQKYLPQLASVRSANFKTPYQEEVQSLDDYNGKLVSYGKVMEKGQNFIPVLFELDNLSKLIPGSFVELFLLTEPVKNALIIPKSAVMQDYSSNYVYVQTGGESFEKREVKLGIDNGVDIQVLSGLKEGEWVVTTGAYQIKMASMSSAIPAHGHSH